MKLLLALLMLAGAARAEVADCPKRHPESQARLTGAGFYAGPNKEAELIGMYEKVPGGSNRSSGFHPGMVKWLVCAYADRQLWWRQMDRHTTHCTIEERGKHQITARLVCK